MDLIDQLRALSARIALTKDLVSTEEATKNAMVMPFIQALGYNVFDPTEVTPELIADVGTKKEKRLTMQSLRRESPSFFLNAKRAVVTSASTMQGNSFDIFTLRKHGLAF